MNRCAILPGVLALVAAAGAHARDLGTDDFDWHASLTTERSEGLHQLQLGEDALLAAKQSGLRDLRIFNANGEALPVAQLPAAAPAEAGHGPPLALRMAPLPGSPQARDRALAEYALRLVRDQDRTVLEIGPAPGAATSNEPSEPGGYLLDLRPLKDRQGELRLHFSADAPDYANTVTLSGSDDLVSWRLISSGPLARNRQLGETVIERASFGLSHPPAFARVLWPPGAAPRLDAASFSERVAAPVTPALRTPLRLVALQDGGWLIDVPVGLPLIRIAIHAPQANQAMRVDLLCPQFDAALSSRRHLLHELSDRTPPQPWFKCMGGLPVYRAERSGESVENPPFAIPGRPAQLQLKVVDPRNYEGPPPSVEAEWRPVRLAFLARAPGPYQLAVGHEGAEQGPTLNLADLLSREDPAGVQLPSALTEAAPVDAARAATRAAQSARNQERWRWSLWAVLLLAVAALAALAWQLAKNIRR